METEQIKSLFETRGGEFITPLPVFTEKLRQVNSVLFDWDGVFNMGEKFMEGSPFGESDSMGTNMLRFALWTRLGKMPLSILLSGEHNKVSFQFGQRENFDYVFYKIANKPEAIDYLHQNTEFRLDHSVFFFDDVLDLPIAEKAALRIMIRRKASPLFEDYVRRNKLADYITYSEGGSSAVREGCELILGLMGFYDEVIRNRTAFTPEYQHYLKEKKAGRTQLLSKYGDRIGSDDPIGFRK